MVPFSRELNSSLIFSILEMKRRQSLSRQQILDLQEKQFRNLLTYVWNHSVFYRKLFQSHGIKEKNLHEVAITDLPFTSKELLMEHFDQVVTDKRLKKNEIKAWVEKEQDPTKLYKDEFIIVNTSGTSGNIGIFVYDRRAWSTIRASVITRVSQPKLTPWNKNKAVFYGATNGRFGGISLIRNAPKLFYNLKIFSLLSPISEVVQQLNIFQPEQISGYASAVAMLAEQEIKNKLRISPEKIVVSGDPLTTDMEKLIKKVWNIEVINYYATTEAICIAARLPGDENMSVFDDTHIVELVNKNMEEVKIGETGEIVITSLYNYTLPLIRYQLRDLAVKGNPIPQSQFGSIAKIIGRVNDALPITLDNGEVDSLHPVMLAGFYTEGLQKIQFVSHHPKKIVLKYMAKTNIEADVLFEFNKLLKAKGATKMTKVYLEKVTSLPNDHKTGKYRLVVKL